MARASGLGMATLLAATGMPGVASAAERQPAEILLLTDVHFDPFADPLIANGLNNAASNEWSGILGRREGTIRFPDCGEEEPVTDAALFQSAMDQMDQRQVAFTVLSGDLLIHEFQCRFTTLFPEADDAAYREFAARTVEFVLSEVRRATHGRPVYLAPGNHDSGCGNYRRDDADPFLQRIAPAVADAAGGAEQQAIARSFAAHGRYEVTAPGSLGQLSLLVADTSLWSRRAMTCGGEARASDEEQLGWVGERADVLGEDGAVWLIGHIPPGFDPRGSALSGSPVRYLQDDELPLMLAQAEHPVRLALFGHTHMDEWRVFGDVPVRISPALSPGSGNRPSFTIAQISVDGGMNDYSVISYNSAAGSWDQDHGFSQSFGRTGFNAENLDLINNNINNEFGEDFLKYNKNYSTGGAPSMPDWTSWVSNFRCAFSSLEEREFAQCVKQGVEGK